MSRETDTFPTAKLFNQSPISTLLIVLLFTVYIVISMRNVLILSFRLNRIPSRLNAHLSELVLNCTLKARVI